MRAKGTLAALCALIGALAVTPQLEAAERNARSVQKAPRVTQAQPVVRPVAQAPRPATRTAQDKRTANRTVATARTAPTQAATRAAPNTRTAAAARPAQSAGRDQPAATPVSMGASLRPALRGVGAGTPILPVSQSSGLSCVPFARMATGMDISGNGGQWWHNAAGRYQRGRVPERGSILAMPGSGGMRLGHVAVVSRVVNDRTIEIDHANWGGPGLRRGQVLRGAVVIDVSDRGDWSAVRVQVGHDRTSFGRVYPVQGFIYNRRPNGETILVDAQLDAAGRFNEVAEAPSPHTQQHLRMAAELLGN